jgi:hypothetical protein
MCFLLVVSTVSHFTTSTRIAVASCLRSLVRLLGSLICFAVIRSRASPTRVVASPSRLVHVHMADLGSAGVSRSLPSRPRFSNAGSKSIESMIASARSNRILSKQKVRQLNFTVPGRPSTQRIHDLTWNRFFAFRQHTLQQRYE